MTWSSLFSIFSTITLTIVQSQEPSEYILSFNQTDNPLRIKVAQPYSKNYFITFGDWGANSGDGTDLTVQQNVAKKLVEFVNNQTANGMNLLFIASVGDNFYWTGISESCEEWSAYWQNVYGSVARDYIWFSVMGNHDWGNNDKYAMCAWTNPYYIDPDTKIPYASNQLSQSKKGCAPYNYYLPDFGYYYTINELNFELISLDQSYIDCPGGIGGDSSGSNQVFDQCGGSSVGCGYLTKIGNACESMLVSRAENSPNSNFLLNQHYPQNGRILNMFKNNRQNNNNDIISSIYGHVHEQTCNSYTTDPYGRKYCEEILTGGGGGCCSGDYGNSRGFFVFQFDDDGHMYQPYNINDPDISCTFPCD